jgi:PemK-like, MazF-like toxin of type II toxin-antitoxin system
MSNSRRLIAGLVGAGLALFRERDRLSGKTRRQSAPTTRRVATGTQVEYSPDIDGAADPGEVVWTWVPYEEDPTKGKDRPVVIIGRCGDDLAGVPLTSKNKGDGAVAVGTGGWDRSGRPSWAKVDQLIVVRERDVRREGSILDRRRFDAVVAGVGQHHDLAGPSS